MSAADFQLLHDEKTDNSIMKRDLGKIYHQNGQQINDENQCIKFFFGENLNSIQEGDGYLEVDINI